MQKRKLPSTSTSSTKSRAAAGVSLRPDAGRMQANPLDYDHPFPSMAEFAKLLNLRHDSNRTRHAYYRDLRLIHQHVGKDPALVTEPELRDYILHVKNVKGWKPKTIRQTAASAKIFSQIKTKDHDELPPVLTGEQVRQLLLHVRLRRTGSLSS